jgi:hypothetical protein
MMDQDRNLGVTEARFALTIVICLLVAVGYLALMRLGGTSEPVVEEGPDNPAQLSVGPIDPTPTDNSNEPEVLKVDPPLISNRPEPRKTPSSEEPGNGTNSRDSFVLPASSNDSQRR